MAVKLNTQTSVVDYLKSQGQDSSMSARKKLAESYGMTNYSGSYDQNIKLHNLLKQDAQKPVSIAEVGGSIGKDASGSTPKADKPKNETPKAEVVDSVVPASTPAPSAGVSQDVWDTMNTTFTAPSAYDEAMSLTMGMLEKISSGRTSYTDQIKALMEQIQNREDFSYDVSQDTLFQQSLASAMASGKTAMQDTIGQASALTGGYGSTYATSAGNQAYNAYIQDAYANLPEYYQMALEAYQMEGQEMYDQLAMLNTADATEYQRNYDAWSANFANAQNIYNQAYGEWQDSINNAYNMGNLQLNEQGQLFDQTSALYSQEFDEWRTMADHAYNEKALKQDDDHFDANLKEEQRQFDARYDVNGDGVVDSKEYDSLSDSQISTLQRIWYEKGGANGTDETIEQASQAILNQLSVWGKTNVDMEALDSLLGGYEPELWEANWEISNDTDNGWWIFGKGEDHNDEYSTTINGKTITKTYDELKEIINDSDLTEAEKKKLLKQLQDKSTK